jgi:rhodanese-related sulfurtransferase
MYWNRGYRNVKALFGGIDGWKEEGYPMKER